MNMSRIHASWISSELNKLVWLLIFFSWMRSSSRNTFDTTNTVMCCWQWSCFRSSKFWIRAVESSKTCEGGYSGEGSLEEWKPRRLRSKWAVVCLWVSSDISDENSGLDNFVACLVSVSSTSQHSFRRRSRLVLKRTSCCRSTISLRTQDWRGRVFCCSRIQSHKSVAGGVDFWRTVADEIFIHVSSLPYLQPVLTYMQYTVTQWGVVSSFLVNSFLLIQTIFHLSRY